MHLEPILYSSIAIGVCVFLLWLISLRMRDASIADIWWGPGFAVIAWVAALNTNPEPTRYGLVTLVMTLWAFRLASFMARRNLGHGEDRRYQAMRGESSHFWWVSLFKVFFLQGALQIIVSLPVFAAAQAETPINAWDVVGIGIALAGLVTEALADHQLSRFKANPNNKGQVMDQGLWGFSRHPNYFGNATLWVGMGIVGIASGGPWWSLAGPALMIFLLLKVSGVSMLEATITERRPAYRQYMNDVSAFVPWPKKVALPGEMMIRTLKAFAAVCITMTVIDLAWLGLVADSLYSELLGPLRAKETVVLAAVLFYLQYVMILVFYAVLPSPDLRTAAKRGLGVGWVAYATYELTNWAVIEGWPAALVPIDIAWGLVLTTVVAIAGRVAAGPPPSQ